MRNGLNVNATGRDTDNKITGNAGKNVLSGGNGNDTLIGAGDIVADTLIGGAGDDTYIIDGAIDVISDTGGFDTVISDKSFVLATGSSAAN